MYDIDGGLREGSRNALRSGRDLAMRCGFCVGLLAEALSGQTAAHAQSIAATDQDQLSQICTDRPTKSNYACTVDAGHLQYESDLVNSTFTHEDGVSTDTWLIVNPTLKYGVTSNIDVEANISPLEIMHVSAPGAEKTLIGVSDLYLRMKYEFLNIDDGGLQATILPYVKVPTAKSGLGNGAVEEGVIVPFNYKLSDKWYLTTDPELDILKDQAGDGRHLNTAQLVNISYTATSSITLYAELWGDWNIDPIGTIRQFTADTAISYGLTPYFQLDAGLNVGLNHAAPGLQAYIGMSQKF